MAYSKSATAQQLGISKDELESKAKSAGFNSTEAYISANGGGAGLISKSFKDKITQDIIAIDKQLDELFKIGLTDAEKEQFLQKAIAEIQPYYDKKTAEINQQLQEGKIRTAE